MQKYLIHVLFRVLDEEQEKKRNMYDIKHI